MSSENYIKQKVSKLGLTDIALRSVPMSMLPLNKPVKPEHNRVLDKSEHHRYRVLVGVLRYLTTVARPDIANAVRRLSHQLARRTVHHMKMALDMFGYVNNTRGYKLEYKIRDVSDKKLWAYADASFGVTDKNMASVIGAVIMFAGAPIYWHSERISTVCKSTKDSELIALYLTAYKVAAFRRLLSELGQFMNGPTVIYEDNRPLRQALRSGKLDSTTPHVVTKFNNVRMDIKNSLIQVEAIDTENQLADMFTKTFGRQKLLDAIHKSGE